MLKTRIKAIKWLLTISFILITIRVFNIQTISGKQYSIAAALQQMRNRVVYLERGDILDRNGIRFTNRESKWKAILQPATLLKDTAELRTIADIFGMTVENLKNKLAKSNLPYVIDVSPAQAKAIGDASMNGLSVMDVRVRNSNTTLATHLLGYVDPKGEEGKAGIEKAYQTTLRRGGGVYAGVIADAGNSFMSSFGYRLWNDTGKEKMNVKLTLDYHMQQIVEESMDRMVDKGAVVILDILTGDILAMASRPSFDPSNINPSLTDQNQPLYNRALGAYTPGSIFKIVTAAAALEKDISPDQTYNCPGYAD
ncbi:MAG: penicillin-binding transpeptidase domain-containing protein, partial [Clostridia bacterium]|nr:penicillin-binding transpeptidase domain-containing protein [Clostridia bacterium]